MDDNNMYQNQASGTENGQGAYNQDSAYSYSQNSSGENGYEQSGYGQSNSQNAYNQNGYNQDGYGQNAYNQDGYGQNAYNQNGYGQNAYNQGGYNQNPGYPQYPYNNYNGGYQQQLDLEEPVKMGEWLICFLITLIPCVNIVMMFVWAFSKTEKKSKSNFYKANLIFAGIIFGIYFILIILMVALGISEYWY